MKINETFRRIALKYLKAYKESINDGDRENVLCDLVEEDLCVIEEIIKIALDPKISSFAFLEGEPDLYED